MLRSPLEASCATHQPAPHELLRTIQHDLLVKGGTTAEIIRREAVEADRRQVRRLGVSSVVSTMTKRQRANMHAGHSRGMAASCRWASKNCGT